MMSKRAAAALVWVIAGTLMLAGCSSATEDPSIDPVEQTPVEATTPSDGAAATENQTHSASPVPESMTIEEAAAHYLELLATLNATAFPPQAESDAAMNSGDWMHIRDVLYGGFPEAYRAFGQGLESAVWPPEVRAAVDNLLEHNDEMIAFKDAIATAPTEEAFEAALQAQEVHYHAKVAAGTWNSETNAVRAILGLPLGATE